MSKRKGGRPRKKDENAEVAFLRGYWRGNKKRKKWRELIQEQLDQIDDALVS